MSIARFAVTRRVTVAMLATAFVLLGLFALPRLPLSLLPSFQPPIVTVTISYPNVAPETIETQVTRPVENAVSRVNGIDILQSNSFQGLSSVRVQFHYGVDINTAAVDVLQQVGRIRNQLPNDPNLQQPVVVKADPNSLPVIALFVSDDLRMQRDLYDLWNNYLSAEINAVDGVALVSLSGGQQRAIMVQPDQTKLAGDDLTADQLVTRIAAENIDLPGGIARVDKKEFLVRTNALYKNAQEVGDTLIATRNGAPIYLRDVASVTDSIQEQRIFTRLNGHSAIAMQIIAQPDANVVNVAQGVQKKLDELKLRYPSMHMGTTIDQRAFIVDSISALEHTAVYGAVLAVLIILLFLHSWRSTIIVAVSLPTSVLGTLFAAYIFHQSLNTMTLGGIALAVGLIVDDAIVVIENIYRHMESGQTAREAAESGTAQILSAVLASSVTVITVFVPLFLIPGLQGLIFGPFALMVITAVAISFVIALTAVPMLASVMLRSESLASKDAPSGNWYTRFSRGFDHQYERFAGRYNSFLRWSLDRPAIILGSGALIFVVTLVAVHFGVVQTETFPASNSRFARFDVKLPVGTALSETMKAVAIIEARMHTDKRVTFIGDVVGGAYGGGQQLPITNRAQLQVTLRPGTTSAEAAAFVGSWMYRLNGRGGRNRFAANAGSQIAPEPLPGVTVIGRTIDVLQQQIAQGQDEMTIQIYGPDVATLFKLATKAMGPLRAAVDGIGVPDTNLYDSQPEIDVKINRARVAHLGFTTGQVAQAVATATNGTIASYYQLNGNEYPIIVQLPPNQRRTYAAIAGLSLTPPIGGQSTNSLLTGATPQNTVLNAGASAAGTLPSIPLLDMAQIVIGTGPSQIARQDKQRRIDIDAPLINAPLGRAVAQATDVMNSFALPTGYRWQYGPSVKQQADTFSGLGLTVILAILLIYMLLASQFESFLHPLVIMMSVPLSVTGVVLSLIITHRSFGLTAFIGTLMLVGIVVKNAILVVEFTNQLRRGGREVRDALVHAATMRLRPILMTTLATIAGMVPLALGFEAGSETQAPLGTVVIGGLLTSTLLSLIVVPTLYLWTARYIEPRFGIKPPSLRRLGELRPPEPEPERSPALQ